MECDEIKTKLNIKMSHLKKKKLNEAKKEKTKKYQKIRLYLVY